MENLPVTAVWEITMGCNMRCDHCGSSCAAPLPDELTTDEALSLCDDLKRAGLQWITLSGGEPLTRKDWPLIAAKLSRNKIKPNIITNGWMVDRKMVATAKKCGVETISISLDGNRDTHDAIRMEGAFDKVLKAFRVLKEANHISASNTTVTRHNLDQLNEIKEILVSHAVDLWQIQIGLPMGNLAKDREAVVSPASIDDLLDFCHRTTLEGKIKVFPADCLGYYTRKEGLTRRLSMGSSTDVIWQGCNAGKRSFGILHNGDILGCTSIRDGQMIEGNVRNRSLVDIWQDPGKFHWARSMKKTDLKGFCKTCAYGETCLGGCPNTRLTINGSIYSDNPWCAYHNAMAATRKTLNSHRDTKSLMAAARSFSERRQWQAAGLVLERVQELFPNDADSLELYGFVSFMLGNYDQAARANEAVLAQNSDNVYAMKGLGLSLHRLGRSREGIVYLEKAARCNSSLKSDTLHDLAVVYQELSMPARSEGL